MEFASKDFVAFIDAEYKKRFPTQTGDALAQRQLGQQLQQASDDDENFEGYFRAL